MAIRAEGGEETSERGVVHALRRGRRVVDPRGRDRVRRRAGSIQSGHLRGDQRRVHRVIIPLGGEEAPERLGAGEGALSRGGDEHELT